MAASVCVCPHCQAPLNQSGRLRVAGECPRCGKSLPGGVQDPVLPTPPSDQPAPGILVSSTPAKPAVGILVSSQPSKPAVGILVPSRSRSSRAPGSRKPPAEEKTESGASIALYAGLGLLVLVVLSGVTWALVAHERSRSRLATNSLAEQSSPDTETPSPPETRPTAQGTEPTGKPGVAPREEPAAPAKRDVLAGYVRAPAGGDNPPRNLPKSLRLPGEGEPEWASSLTPKQQARVNRAIDEGVEFLKDRLAEGKSDNWLARPGAVALAGLTLAACDVPPDDPVLHKVAGRVRRLAEDMTETYDLSLAILFLDRLGDPQDRPLMRTLALRLLAGQNEAGGWSYTCPKLSPAAEEQFLSLLESLAPIDASALDMPAIPGRSRTGPEAAPPDRLVVGNGKKRPFDRGPAAVNLKELPVIKLGSAQKMDGRAGGDNSNTQFAILAVWAARKHGVPVDRTLTMIEARFRTTQNSDGSWGYVLPNEQWPDSMTCAGLLGLGVGHGVVRRREGQAAPGKDAEIEKGLKYLGSTIDRAEPARRSGRGRFGTGKIIGANAHGDLYYLWSLERVAVVYDMKTIDGKDWYAWGANLLVEHQGKDGSWSDSFPGVPDTCFALLFLKRANVAQDLTAKLRTFDNLIDQDDRARPR